MNPKATIPTIPNPVGTRFVATWPDDCSGWQITRHEPGTVPVSAGAFADSLPSRTASPVLASFLEHASPMAVFELDCDGQRKAVGLKLMSHCSNPVFYRQTLTAGPSCGNSTGCIPCSSAWTAWPPTIGARRGSSTCARCWASTRRQPARASARPGGCDNEFRPTCADEFWPTLR